MTPIDVLLSKLAGPEHKLARGGRAEMVRQMPGTPDPRLHRWAWVRLKMAVRWCVAMRDAIPPTYWASWAWSRRTCNPQGPAMDAMAMLPPR